MKHKDNNIPFEGHIRNGKKIIPHLLAYAGPFKEISWTCTIIPEIIWTALVNSKYGYQEGARLSLSFGKALYQIKPNAPATTISQFVDFSDDDKKRFYQVLSSNGDIHSIREALTPLLYYYPLCPLRFLCVDENLALTDPDSELNRIKTTLIEIFDKTSKEATFVQANILYIAFAVGKLKVSQGLSLASFPEVEKYPDTDLSKQVASSIRASMMIFFSENASGGIFNWPDYFWDRGLDIDKCEVETHGG